MHSAGVMHGDIRASNLCMLPSGEAFIIDLSHAHMNGGAEEMTAEMVELCGLLGMNRQEAMLAIRGPKLKPQPLPSIRRSARIKNMTRGKVTSGDAGSRRRSERLQSVAEAAKKKDAEAKKKSAAQTGRGGRSHAPRGAKRNTAALAPKGQKSVVVQDPNPAQPTRGKSWRALAEPDPGSHAKATSSMRKRNATEDGKLSGGPKRAKASADEQPHTKPTSSRPGRKKRAGVATDQPQMKNPTTIRTRRRGPQDGPQGASAATAARAHNVEDLHAGRNPTTSASVHGKSLSSLPKEANSDSDLKTATASSPRKRKDRDDEQALGRQKRVKSSMDEPQRRSPRKLGTSAQAGLSR